MSKLRKTSDGNMPVRASLLAEKVEGASTISVSRLTGWAQGQRQDFIICKYDSDKKIVPGSVTSWTGVPASNGTIGALQLTGGQDQQYPIGAAVVSSPTSAWANDLIDALLTHHDANGNLKSNTVTYDHIDETTEYKFIASPNDLNDAQFLVPGKWRFGNNQQVRNTKNLPSPGETGILQTITHSSGIPGRNPWSYSIQIFTLLNTRMFMRTASTGDSATDIKYRQWQEFAVIKKPDSPQESGWNVYINPVNGKKRYWREGNTQGGRLDNGAFTYVETGIKFPANTRVINATALATDQSISATPRAAVENISFCVQSHYQNANAHVYWYYELEEK